MNVLCLEQTIYTVLRDKTPHYQLKLVIQEETNDLWHVEMLANGSTLYTDLQVTNGTNTYILYAPVSTKDYELKVKLSNTSGECEYISCIVRPRKEWDISFIPITHHDYGYTEVIDRLKDLFCVYYEDVLKFCAMTDGYPDEAKYRYTVECTWSLVYWLDKCSEKSKETFLKYAREGRIDVMAFYAHVADTNCSSEELIRLMYPAFELQRRYGLRIESAAFTDMPGLSWGVPKILHAAGVKYFFAGMPAYFDWVDICGVHDMGNVHSFWDEHALSDNGRPFAYHWKGQDESSVLTYYQGSYGWFLGDLTEETEVPNTLQEIEEHLPAIIQDLESRGVKQDCIRFIDHGVDNYPPQITISNIVRRWNEKYLSPKLRVDTNTGFFRRLENCGIEFPTFCGEIPHTDYNVETLSFVKEQSVNNITHVQVQSAETVATMNTVLTGERQRQTDIEKIYQDMMLFDEHCVGMARPFGRVYDWNWSSKSHHAYRASAMADEVLSESVYGIAKRIKGKKEEKIVTVFNPTSTPVTDIVTIANYHLGDGGFFLEDTSTGEKLIAQTRVINDPYLPCPFAAHRYSMYRMGKPEITYATELQFVAKDVPAYGYKSYILQPAESTVDFENEKDNLVIENEYYRIEADPISGSLSSVWDKSLNREFVDKTAPYRFGEVVVRDVVTERNQKYVCKEATCCRRGKVKQSILIKGSSETCPQITVEFILYQGLRKIDVAVRVLKDYAPLVEAFVVFPFAVDNPQLLYDGTNCIVRPFKDQFPGSNTNYYSVQDWAMVKNEEATALVAPLESHIVEFGGLWHTYVSQAHHSVHPEAYGAPYISEDAIKRGQIAVMLFYSSARTNFSVTQTGDFLFRFSLLTGDQDLSYGNFHQTNSLGLVPVLTNGNEFGTLPNTCSLLRVQEPNVRAITCKLSEDCHDAIVVRLEERCGETGVATLNNLAFRAYRVELVNIVEEVESVLDVCDNEIIVPLHAYETKTLRIYWKEYDPSRYDFNNDKTVEFRY